MFKNQLNSTRLLLMGIWLPLLIVSCQPTISEANETVIATIIISNGQATALPVATTITQTHLIAQTVTSKSTLTPSPTSSPTPQPSLTPLPTEIITLTPWPILPPDEAAEKVLSLLADNQNPDCLLPCWWGAIPGKTQWQDIEPFLKSFALEIKTDSSAALVYLPLHESIKVPGYEGYVSYSWDESGIISGISLKSMNIAGYDPKTMMTLYGIPDEVWLKTMEAPREGILPFQLILVYQEQGISFRYYVDAIKTGETVTACFEPGAVEVERPDLFPSGPRIYLWESGQHKTIDEIANIPQEVYFPLEEKTDLTPQTLYEKFTDPNEQPCIDTLGNLW